MTIIGNSGDEVGLDCPKGCGGTIRYSGNYFCSNWVYPYTGEGCNWALSHGEDGEPEGELDQFVWKTIKRSRWFKQAVRHK